MNNILLSILLLLSTPNITFSTPRLSELYFSSCDDLLMEFSNSNQASLDIYNDYEYFYILGDFYKNNHLYKEALFFYNQSLVVLPTYEASLGKIYCLFELENLEELPIEYTKFQQLHNTAKNLSYAFFWEDDSESSLSYSVGFSAGILEGGAIGVVEIIPSIYTSISGISHCLWAYVNDPVEFDKQFGILVGELISEVKENYAVGNYKYFLPKDFEDLLVNWDSYGGYQKGRHAGLIIGKYGVNILVLLKTSKWIQKVEKLELLNTELTAKAYTGTPKSRALMLERQKIHQSAIRTVTRVNNKQVVPHSYNHLRHIMQDKHAWNQLVPIKGKDLLEDFKLVCKVLEDNDFLNPVNIERSITRSDKVKSLIYRKNIQGKDVVCYFIENMETGELTLCDGWIQTR